MATGSKKQALLKKMLAETKKIRQDNEQRGSKFEKVDWFIAQKGDNAIRILPAKTDDDVFYKQVKTHFMPIKKKDGGMAQIPVRCLTDFDEDCPLCVAYARMVKSKDADEKDKAQRLRPNTRYLTNVLNYAERKVQPFAMPSTVFDGVSGWMEEFQSDISDPDEGRDFKVIKKVKGGKTEYEVRPSLKDSAIPDKLKVLLDTMVDLDTLYKENERTRMEEYLESIGEEVEASAPVKKKAKPPVDDEDEDEVDEDEEEAPPVKKKKPVEEDEEDEDDEEEDLADEDEDEEEDDEDLEEEDDEEEEEEPPAKVKAAKAKAAAVKAKAKPEKKKAKKKDDDEDFGVDLDDDDLEKEFENLDL